MKKQTSIIASVAAIAAWSGPIVAFAQADASNGEALFNARCKTCHDPAIERAPGRAELAIRPRADIEKSLTDGVMAPMAKEMSAADVGAVALFLTSTPRPANAGARRGGSQVSAGAAKVCESHPPIAAR